MMGGSYSRATEPSPFGAALLFGCSARGSTTAEARGETLTVLINACLQLFNMHNIKRDPTC